MFAREGHLGDFDYVEVIMGDDLDPDGVYPLVVLLHGRGDRPRIPGVRLRGLPTPVRIFLPRAPDRLGDGYTWIATSTTSGDEVLLSRSLNATADLLAAAITAFMEIRPTVGRPVIAGFSQGAILTWTMVTHRPGLFAAAFPIAGYIPEPLWPTERPGGPVPYTPGLAPGIHALHGAADPIVPLAYGRRTVEAMRARGHPIDFTIVPLVTRLSNPSQNPAALEPRLGVAPPRKYSGISSSARLDSRPDGSRIFAKITETGD